MQNEEVRMQNKIYDALISFVILHSFFFLTFLAVYLFHNCPLQRSKLCCQGSSRSV